VVLSVWLFFKPELYSDKLLPTDVDVVINKPVFDKEFYDALDEAEIEYQVFKIKNREKVYAKSFLHNKRLAIEISPLQKQENGQFLPAESFEEDAKFRELKCNSILYDLKTENLIDPVENNCEPSVKFNPDTCLVSDPSRMYRFFRISAEQKEVSFHQPSIEKILEHKHLLSKEPVAKRQLRRIMSLPEPGVVINKIIESGLSEDMLAVKIDSLVPEKCVYKDLVKHASDLKDVPKIAEAFNLPKDEAYELLYNFISRDLDYEKFIDEHGYMSCQRLVSRKLMKSFKSRFLFAEDRLEKLTKNSYRTDKMYASATKTPDPGSIKEYLAMNF